MNAIFLVQVALYLGVSIPLCVLTLNICKVKSVALERFFGLFLAFIAGIVLLGFEFSKMRGYIAVLVIVTVMIAIESYKYKKFIASEAIGGAIIAITALELGALEARVSILYVFLIALMGIAVALAIKLSKSVRKH